MSEIQTARLTLRPLRQDDLDEWHAVIFDDPDVTRYLPMREPIPRERVAEMLARRISDWSEHGFGVWALVERDARRLIGHCGFLTAQTSEHVELIYALGRDRWGRGLATEAAGAALRYGFGVGLVRVSALAFPENETSIRVMRKLGFTLDGTTNRFGAELVRYRVTAAAFRQSERADHRELP